MSKILFLVGLGLVLIIWSRWIINIFTLRGKDKMKKDEIRIKKVVKAIKEIRESKIDFRECLILANNYDSKEAKIFRKGFNSFYRFLKDKSKQGEKL